MVKVFHYTEINILKNILDSGGNFWPSRGGRYEPDKSKYYLTDLVPETSNSTLQTALFGVGSIITSDGSRHQIKGSAYLELKVNKRDIIQSGCAIYDPPGRQHVFYILANEPGRLFEIVECGRRSGWRYSEVSGRDPWNLSKFVDAFKKKKRYNNGIFYLQCMMKRV